MTTAERSARMALIRSKDTKPEVAVRRLLHGLGYRYRLHRSDLPGCPDLVFKAKRKVIFVHGCFWHLHAGCADDRVPKSRTSYWGPKLKRNVERDKEVRRRLRVLGWESHVVWECEVAHVEKLALSLRAFLDG
ncbi:MAG TPA: very short patch repair endonuclease, partial [Bryobacteraceae bacterium]|nr:very short patch repair endonuclease [Bryobacteraceae bacterium]